MIKKIFMYVWLPLLLSLSCLAMYVIPMVVIGLSGVVIIGCTLFYVSIIGKEIYEIFF